MFTFVTFIDTLVRSYSLGQGFQTQIYLSVALYGKMLRGPQFQWKIVPRIVLKMIVRVMRVTLKFKYDPISFKSCTFLDEYDYDSNTEKLKLACQMWLTGRVLESPFLEYALVLVYQSNLQNVCRIFLLNFSNKFDTFEAIL